MTFGRGIGRMGDTTTTAAPASGFVAGAEEWMTPGTAFTNVQGVFTSPSTAFGSSNLMTTLGLLAVPAVLLFLLMGGKHRR